MKRTLIIAIVILACFIIVGCEYDVPITAQPTRAIDTALLGDWTSRDGKDTIKVNRWDGSNYVVWQDGSLFRVYHSDVENSAFVSVQLLAQDKPKYAYWSWKLSNDGTLHLRIVDDQLVPDDTTNSARVQELLKQNLQNPTLLGNETEFLKSKSD